MNHSYEGNRVVLSEFFASRTGERGSPPDPLETALFLESEFGVVVSEAHLEEGRLGSRESAVALLDELRHVEG